MSKYKNIKKIKKNMKIIALLFLNNEKKNFKLIKNKIISKKISYKFRIWMLDSLNSTQFLDNQFKKNKS